MTNPKCNDSQTRSEDCFNCPFLPDPYNPDRLVCVKCGKDYTFNRLNSGNGFGSVLLLVLFAILMVIALNSDAARRLPQNRPLPQRGTPEWRSQI